MDQLNDFLSILRVVEFLAVLFNIDLDSFGIIVEIYVEKNIFLKNII